VIYFNGVQLSQVLSQLNTQAALTIFNDSNVAFAQIAAGATLNSQCLAELTMDILTIITLEVHAEVLQALHGICDILVGVITIMLKLIIWSGECAVIIYRGITTKLCGSIFCQVLQIIICCPQLRTVNGIRAIFRHHTRSHINDLTLITLGAHRNYWGVAIFS